MIKWITMFSIIAVLLAGVLMVSAQAKILITDNIKLRSKLEVFESGNYTITYNGCEDAMKDLGVPWVGGND